MSVENKKFAFISCVNDEDQYQECLSYINALEVPEGYTIEVKKVLGASGMAEGYQQAVNESNAKYKIYLHQDTFLLNKKVLFEILDLFQDPSIGMIGVVGATRLPRSGVWFHNGLESFGKLWEHRRGGGIKRFLGPYNRRADRLMTFRPVPQKAFPVVVIDGLLMVTQYDLPWRTDLGMGFIYYEAPQCCEFIKQGYKVVVPRQEEIWCMHYGPRTPKTKEEFAKYQDKFKVHQEKFRAAYPEFIMKHVDALLAEYSTRRGD